MRKPGGMSNVKKRSMTIGGRRTSIGLEDEFWNALREIARGWGITATRLVNDIAKQGELSETSNLSSAVRVYILRHYQSAKAGTNPPGAG